MNDDVLSKIADRIDRAADRLRFTGKIAEAEACSQAASRIRAGMSIERAQAIEAFFIFGISSGVRTRLSALSGSGEYDGSSAVTSPQPQGANTLSLNSPDLPPAGQSGQASMGMETISQNMQYAAALSQDSYVDPYIGVQYPTDPLLTDPLKGGPSPYYPGGQSVNSYNAKSPAASPSGQTPDLYSAFQNFNAYGAPGTGFDSSLSPFFPSSGGGFDTSQMWASNGPTPGNSAGTPDTPGSVQKIPQGSVTRNGNSYAQFLVTINGVPQYYEYMNDFLGRDWTEPLQSPTAPQPAQPIPAAPAPSQTQQPAQPIATSYDPWANESWISRWINSGSGGYLQNDQNLANLQNSIMEWTVYTELLLASGGVGYALGESALLNATSWQAFKAALIPVGAFVSQQLYTFNTGALPLTSAPLGPVEGSVPPASQVWSFSTESGQPTLILGENAPSLGYDANTALETYPSLADLPVRVGRTTTAMGQDGRTVQSGVDDLAVQLYETANANGIPLRPNGFWDPILAGDKLTPGAWAATHAEFKAFLNNDFVVVNYDPCPGCFTGIGGMAVQLNRDLTLVGPSAYYQFFSTGQTIVSPFVRIGAPSDPNSFFLYFPLGNPITPMH
jgi:hypothetical protein